MLSINVGVTQFIVRSSDILNLIFNNIYESINSDTFNRTFFVTIQHHSKKPLIRVYLCTF